MIYNGHTLQGVDNAEALIGRGPEHVISSIDPALLVFCVFVLVLCAATLFLSRRERKNNKTPDILSLRELLILLCSGPSLLFLFITLKQQFSLPFSLSVWVSFAFTLQGYIALRFIFRRDPIFSKSIEEKQKIEIESGTSRSISVGVIRFLVTASTIVGGGIIFLLFDIFLFQCHFTQMGPCPSSWTW